MKPLKQFISEMHIKDYNEDEYSKDENHTKYKDLAEKYIEFATKTKNADDGAKEFKKFVDTAIIKTNEVLKIFANNGISGFVNGQLIGRIIEAKLVESLNFKDFKFEQGVEISDNKDITCIKVSEDFLNLGGPSAYGIEVKCSQGTEITGNKSYAMDVTTNSKDSIKSNKDSFYLLINYKAPSKIPQTVDDQTIKDVANINKVKDFAITDYTCYFGFITQNDWIYGDTGNSSRLKMKVLKNKRLVKIR